MSDKPLFPPPMTHKTTPGDDLAMLTLGVAGVIAFFLGSWKALELMAQLYVWIDKVAK